VGVIQFCGKASECINAVGRSFFKEFFMLDTIIGGAIVLVSSMATTVMQNILSKKTERNAKKREELKLVATEITMWYNYFLLFFQRCVLVFAKLENWNDYTKAWYCPPDMAEKYVKNKYILYLYFKDVIEIYETLANSISDLSQLIMGEIGKACLDGDDISVYKTEYDEKMAIVQNNYKKLEDHLKKIARNL
jgi:hypothetical protein